MHRYTTAILLLVACATKAQVACDIISAGALNGSYAHTWAEPQAGSWATPNMLDPHERVVAGIALAYDASAADSLCCQAIQNPSELVGKVALLYRGTCDYSLKAKHCQDAGALAVVIINNVPGAPAEMGAGSIGAQVTIPVFQISAADGAAWRQELENGGSLTALLGNKDGYYTSDAGFRKGDVLMPKALAYPSLLAANTGEFQIQVAARVHNYGMQQLTGLILRARVVKAGSVLYDYSTAPFALNAGDSAFVTLPDAQQAAWQGRHELIYTLVNPTADQHIMDNEITIPFTMGDAIALAPIGIADGRPISTIGMHPATSSGEFESCIHFRDAHASRVAITGVDRYVSVNTPAMLQGELIFTRVYQWLDGFTGMSDPAFSISSLAQVHEQKHSITATGNVAELHLPFDEPVVLMDGIRYLICTAALNPALFFGYNEDVHYAMNDQVLDQPTSPNRNGSSWFIGFVGGPVASLGARTVDAATIGMDEHARSVGAYPNPSQGVFQLALNDAGPSLITVTDATGRVVSTHRTSGERFTLDLSGASPGVYLVSVEGARGRATGRLVVE